MKKVKKATEKAEAKPEVKTNAEKLTELQNNLEATKAQLYRLEGAIAMIEQAIEEEKS